MIKKVIITILILALCIGAGICFLNAGSKNRIEINGGNTDIIDSSEQNADPSEAPSKEPSANATGAALLDPGLASNSALSGPDLASDSALSGPGLASDSALGSPAETDSKTNSKTDSTVSKTDSKAPSKDTTSKNPNTAVSTGSSVGSKTDSQKPVTEQKPATPEQTPAEPEKKPTEPAIKPVSNPAITTPLAPDNAIVDKPAVDSAITAPSEEPEKTPAEPEENAQPSNPSEEPDPFGVDASVPAVSLANPQDPKTIARIDYVLDKNKNLSNDQAAYLVALFETFAGERDYLETEILMGIARLESGYNPTLTGKYMGMMQVSLYYGQAAGYTEDQLQTAYYNLDYACSILDDLNKKFGGDLLYILLGYNQGYFGLKAKIENGEELNTSFYNAVTRYADQIKTSY